MLNCLRTQYENAEEMKFGATGTVHETKHKIIEASYIIALKIVQQKLPIGETLTGPRAFKMVDIVLGKILEKKFASILFLDKTI